MRNRELHQRGQQMNILRCSDYNYSIKEDYLHRVPCVEQSQLPNHLQLAKNIYSVEVLMTN